ncbi:MAG: transposase [Candidatus Methanofastidiosia archaeon]
MLLNNGFIEHWNEELEKTNMNKRGNPFAFPQSFVAYTVLMKTASSVPYRQLEGILEKLLQYIEGLTSADYTTLLRRIRATEIEIALQEPCEKKCHYCHRCHSMKVTNRGKWMREKWKKRRGQFAPSQKANLWHSAIKTFEPSTDRCDV